MNMKNIFEPVIMNILTAFVQLVVIIAGLYAVSALNMLKQRIEARMGKENYEHMISLIKTLVMAVEQQYPQLAGEGKYNIVTDAFNKKFGNLLTDEEISQLIEAAVGEMNLIKKSGNIKASQTQKSLSETESCDRENTTE
jgi:hypothetical protein